MIKVFLILIAFSFGQFKSESLREIEELLMAPCCGGGTLSEHDDNQHTGNLKFILAALTEKSYNEENILNLFKMTYENPAIYQLEFSPAKTRPIAEILEYVKSKLHPEMTSREMINLFTWIHNERISGMPDNKGFDQIAWKMPGIILLTGIILIFIIVKTFKKQTLAVTGSNSITNLSNEMEQKINKELGEMD